MKEERVKRIYDPVTRKYYVARLSEDGRWEVIGLWSPCQPTKRKKTLLDLIRWW